MPDYKNILEKIIGIENIVIADKSKLYNNHDSQFICTFDFLGEKFELFLPKYFPIHLPKLTVLTDLIHSHIDKKGVVCLQNQEDIDYDIENEEEVIIKTINSLRNLLLVSEEENSKEIKYEFNDYLPFYLNYCEKKCLLCSSINGDKGQLVIEENRILIGIDSTLYKCYKKNSNKNYPFRNYIHLELHSLPKITTSNLMINELYNCLTKSSQKKMEKEMNKAQFFLCEYKLDNGIKNYFLTELEQNKSIVYKNNISTFDTCIKIYNVRDISFEFLRTRGGSIQADEDVLVIGCGSVGSEVVELLSSSGFLNLSIVDYDLLKYENTYRNLTGFIYLNHLEESNKAEVLKCFTEFKYPDVNITIYKENIVELLKCTKLNLKKYKYIIVCVGNNILHKYINKYIYDNNINTKLIFGWLEPYGIAEHILTIDTSKPGCYNCLCKSTNNIHFTTDDVDYKIRNNVCAGSYTPYGKVSTVRLATSIVDLLLNDYSSYSPLGNKHFIRKGNFKKYLQDGYKLTKYANYTQEELDSISKDFVYEGCDICGKRSNNI
ncbi:MAG: ThiF family adenylyltransferase [Erysipelotrichales bacterium]|nr:ThiF family adenylyltransferase [Erysipelotrichales bacterium]